MDKSLCISGAFSNSQMPNLSPHPINDVGHVFPNFFCEFQLCIGWREGQLQETLEKLAVFYEETRKLQKIMNNVTLPQGLLSRIVGLPFSKTFFDHFIEKQTKDSSLVQVNELRKSNTHEGLIFFLKKRNGLFCIRSL